MEHSGRVVFKQLGPPSNVLGSTWYGPALLLSIPITLAWAAQAIKSRWPRIIGTAAALLLAATFVQLIIVGYQRARPHF
jgi:heme/copper-type cytochrome/quinol oxidase subunit 3